MIIPIQQEIKNKICRKKTALKLLCFVGSYLHLSIRINDTRGLGMGIAVRLGTVHNISIRC